MTQELASLYYNKHSNLNLPPFSVWLEDVYIGLLAEEFNTTVNDFTPKNVTHEQYRSITKEHKIHLINQKGLENVLFVYEKTEQKFIWNHLSKYRLI